jgi:hypothetical protein
MRFTSFPPCGSINPPLAAAANPLVVVLPAVSSAVVSFFHPRCCVVVPRVATVAIARTPAPISTAAPWTVIVVVVLAYAALAAALAVLRIAPFDMMIGDSIGIKVAL